MRLALRRRRLAAIFLLFALNPLGVAVGSGAEAGRALFRNGVLPDGVALRGERDGGVSVEGPAAACMVCHRRSGLGSVEGSIVVPPIAGKYLGRAHSTNVPGSRSTRDPYGRADLARAIRDGIDPNGRALDYLMPRYRLNDEDMESLIRYLNELDAAPVPGVTADVLHFATIITPGTDPARRQAMLDVMAQFIADKNSFIRGGVRPMANDPREVRYRVTRRWQLHVWDLTGPSDRWAEELHAKLAAEPVFAVISGLGDRDWAPIHHFCEQSEVPCLFPNVEEPVVAEQDFYPIYFSRGVWLDADLMATKLGTEMAPRPARVIQVYREGGPAAAGAGAVEAAAARLGLTTTRRPLKAHGGNKDEIRDALTGIGPGDALILWLRPPDLAALPPDGVRTERIMVSGLLGDFENAPLPAWWRANTVMTYAEDLPEQRRVRMNFPLGWFRIHNIPIVSERVQVDTYVALGIVSETLNDMLDNFVRDYLVERVETMLSHRLVNGFYPRLSLAQGQRFASKGGYLVHFAAASGTRIVADTGWLTP